MRTIVSIALGALLALGAFITTAHADVANQATRVTFGQDVRVPGRVLPAGTYWFVLFNHGSDLKLVQIYNFDRTELIENLQTQDAVRQDPGGSVMTFAQPEDASKPVALMSWFYPGFTEGHRFVYSGPHESRLESDPQIAMQVGSEGVIRNLPLASVE
jgi:hypothetical protein